MRLLPPNLVADYNRVALSRSPFRPGGSLRGTLAVLALVAFVGVYTRLLSVLREHEVRLRWAGQPEPSWFGYARDGVNLVGFLGIAGGFAALGISLPLAVLIACGYELAVYGIDYLLGHPQTSRAAPVGESSWRAARPTLFTATAALLLLLPVVTHPEPVARGVAHAVDLLFGVPLGR